MKPLRTKVLSLGGSAAIAIPLTLAKMYEWAPGAVVSVKLTRKSKFFEKEVRELYGGRASGVIVPREALADAGVETGDEIDVPFYEWHTVTPNAWPEEGLPGQRRRARRAAREEEE